ncbi:MAG: hypothetical protein ACLP4V_17625 [Methylocella sp.]
MTGGEEATQIVTGATSLPPVSATMWQHVIVSLLWFSLSAQWMTVVPIIVPDQVAVILGGDSAAKDAISGTNLAAGAVVALVASPHYVVPTIRVLAIVVQLLAGPHAVNGGLIHRIVYGE